jgi:hypothetical protein
VQVGGRARSLWFRLDAAGRVADVAASDGSRSAMSDLPGMMRDPVGVRLVPVRVPGLPGQHIALTTFLLSERWRRSGCVRADSCEFCCGAWPDRLILTINPSLSERRSRRVMTREFWGRLLPQKLLSILQVAVVAGHRIGQRLHWVASGRIYYPFGLISFSLSSQKRRGPVRREARSDPNPRVRYELISDHHVDLRCAALLGCGMAVARVSAPESRVPSRSGPQARWSGMYGQCPQTSEDSASSSCPGGGRRMSCPA